MRRNDFGLALAIVVGVFVFSLLALAWWYWDWGHAPTEKLPHLHGQTLENVVAELGEPDTRHEFSMAGGVGGFRVELFNFYPPSDPRTAKVRIKELQWHHMRYHIAVWFHQIDGEWVALNSCRWKEGIVF